MKGSAKAVSAQDLAKLEKELKLKLPEQYRAFLLRNNGGRPEPAGFAKPGEAKATESVQTFFSVDTFGPRPPKLFLKKVPIPDDMLMIANAATGDDHRNRWLIGWSGKNGGKVFFWDAQSCYSQPASEKPSLADYALPVAPNFDAFLAALAPVLTGLGPKVAPEDTLAYEKAAKVSLPDQYRKFLLASNGGNVERCNQIEVRKGRMEVVSVFYCMDASASGPPDLGKEIATYSKRVPADTLPVATDPFGNLVLIGKKGKSLGKVFFWDHENEAEDGKKVGYDNVTLIADTFDEFLAGLRKLPE